MEKPRPAPRQVCQFTVATRFDTLWAVRRLHKNLAFSRHSMRTHFPLLFEEDHTGDFFTARYDSHAEQRLPVTCAFGIKLACAISHRACLFKADRQVGVSETDVASRTRPLLKPFRTTDCRRTTVGETLKVCSTPARATGLEVHDGACGQALNKPEGRKPRSAPMQWESSGLWRLMGLGCPADVAGCAVRRDVESATDAVTKRCSRAIVTTKRTCEGLREATGANVHSWACVAAEPTVGLHVLETRCAHVCASARGWSADRRGARKDIDDDHRRAAVAADEGGPRLPDGFARRRVDPGSRRAAVRAPLRDWRGARGLAKSP